MLGYILAFGSLVVWSLSDLVAKHAVHKSSNLNLIFWGQLLGGVGILALGLLLGLVHAFEFNSLAWVALLALLNSVGMALFYSSIKHKGVALSLPIIYSWSLPTILLSYFFLRTAPSPLQGLGILAVLIGLFLVSIDSSNTRWVDKGTIAALFSMLCWGVFYFLITTPSTLYGEWWTSGAVKIITAVFVLPFLIKGKAKAFGNSQKEFLSVGFIGLCDALGLVFVSYALQMTSNTVVTGIVSSTPAVVAAIGILVYKEKVNRSQLFGIILTVLGLLCLVL